MAVMIAGFGILYLRAVRRVGFAWLDGLLIPSQENGNTLYSGDVNGKMAVFTVSPDKTVQLKYGEKTYGPYTVRDDPTAVPETFAADPNMSGVEIRCGEKLIFRGGVLKTRSDDGLYYLPYNEDGTIIDINVTIIPGDGGVVVQDGKLVDPYEPSVLTIVDLAFGPALSHRGNGAFWFWGVLLCIINALSVLFADEIFRWNMKWTIRNAEGAEPTDWTITMRYISWIVTLIMVLVIFIAGLNQ